MNTTAQGPMDAEQRHGDRVACNVTVQIHAPDEDALLLTHAINLSRTGVYVRANRPLTLGSRVNIELQPRNLGPRIRARGEVVRVSGAGEPRGMGFAFVDLDPAAALALERLVARIDGRPLLAPEN